MSSEKPGMESNCSILPLSPSQENTECGQGLQVQKGGSIDTTESSASCPFITPALRRQRQEVAGKLETRLDSTVYSRLAKPADNLGGWVGGWVDYKDGSTFS